MLGKFKDKGWVKPLLAHVGVHGLLTVLICSYVSFKLAIPLALLDMAIHFTMDRIKSSSKLLGRYKPVTSMQMMQILLFKQQKGYLDPLMVKALNDNKLFWWSLGLDQMVHHLTHYLVIFLLLTH